MMATTQRSTRRPNNNTKAKNGVGRAVERNHHNIRVKIVRALRSLFGLFSFLFSWMTTLAARERGEVLKCIKSWDRVEEGEERKKLKKCSPSNVFFISRSVPPDEDDVYVKWAGSEKKEGGKIIKLNIFFIFLCHEGARSVCKVDICWLWWMLHCLII